ncbi:hypothetical protein H2203_007024 [Taxawa tesnikishii (nom. ined.)]|nr:hypothetical protein H2203_007024 [Dothideales sp. JES 119]
MPSNTTTYLQVPKVLPGRRSRTRSTSRPRGVEVVAPQPIKPRIPTPPIAITTSMSSPKLYSNGYTSSTYHTPRSTSPTSPYHECKYGSPELPKFGSPELTVPIDLNGDFYTLAPSPSPPPEPPLRQRLIGAWRLESYIAMPTPSSTIQRPTYPMTKNVTGLILYTPDGYMSAQMLIPGQEKFQRGKGEEAQWAEAGKRCFSYAGPYYISNEGSGREEVLRHTFQVCNLPGWIGDIQIRTWNFEEDGQVLVLGSEEPTEIKGDKRIPILKWRRVTDNSGRPPPPPMPQIKDEVKETPLMDEHKKKTPF